MWLIDWIFEHIRRWLYPDFDKQVSELEQEAKAQDELNAARAQGNAQLELENQERQQQQVELSNKEQAAEAQADATQKQITEILTPKDRPQLSDDDELERLSERTDS